MLYPPYRNRIITLPDDPDRAASVIAQIQALDRELQIYVGQEWTLLQSDDLPGESAVFDLRETSRPVGGRFDIYGHRIGGWRASVALIVSVDALNRAGPCMVHGIAPSREIETFCKRFVAGDRAVLKPNWDPVKGN